jgi:L-amino acid N-acyltransferase YncA
VLEPGAIALVDLHGDARERAVPVIRDGFVGIYRWHAKRTLREVPTVRAAELHGEVVGVSLLDRLVPEVGYVYYVVVLGAHRGRGLGGLLLDDALRLFRAQDVEVVYAAVQADNVASLRVCERRGFRAVERKETGWREGGLGAWGLRSRMRLVPGERLLGLRLRDPRAATAERASPPSSAGDRGPV